MIGNIEDLAKVYCERYKYNLVPSITSLDYYLITYTIDLGLLIESNLIISDCINKIFDKYKNEIQININPIETINVSIKCIRVADRNQIDIRFIFENNPDLFA